MSAGSHINKNSPKSMKHTALPWLFPALLMMSASPILAKETDPSPVPRLPEHNQFSLIGLEPTQFNIDGSVSWIGVDHFAKTKAENSRCGVDPALLMRWNPATGVTSRAPLSIGVDGVRAQLATPAGILFLNGNNCVTLVSPDGKTMLTTLTQTFIQPRLVLLSNDNIAVVESDEKTRHIRLELLRWRTAMQLEAEAMPALTISYRNDFQPAALPDGQLMILGGSDYEYRGCSPCRAETQVFNPKTKTWRAGPTMLEPRSEHLATRLPDGSILVTGGWTPNHGWGHGPSRSAERWNPVTNKFEAVAPMPSGTARHRALWMPGEEGKTLLIGGGSNSSMHAYDIRAGEWRTVGAISQGSEGGKCRFVPFRMAGNAYTWTVCDFGREAWEVITLRPSIFTVTPPPEKFLVTHQASAAQVPARGNQPALVIGGSFHAGMNSYLATSSAVAVDANGAARSLPSLNDARHGALALRVGAGVLVMGGRGEDSEKTAHADRGGPLLSAAEWLASDVPGSTARWVRMDKQQIIHDSYEQLPDGSLLLFIKDRLVRHVVLNSNDGGAPSLREGAKIYPPLNLARHSTGSEGGYGSSAVKLRALADGRVIVAGGEVVTEKIALLNNDSDRADAIDEYVGIGPYLPSRHHEIYEPAGKRWRTSVPSRSAGGKVAILPDGNVLKIGQLPGKDKDDSDPPYIMEISNAEGTAWTTWPTETLPKIKPSEKAKPFVVDGELFLSGEMGSLTTAGGVSGLEWFNATTGRWEALWWANPYDDWRDHVGRLIVRQLANGKKVILPVHGY